MDATFKKIDFTFKKEDSGAICCHLPSYFLFYKLYIGSVFKHF